MPFDLPQRRSYKQIQTQKRTIPLEQIIAVQGQNPIAQGIDTVGNVLGQAIQKRAELRRQGEELAKQNKEILKLESLAGQQPGTFQGLDPKTAKDFAIKLMEKQTENYTPQQLLALKSDDPKAMGSVFPLGIPPAGATLAATISGRNESREQRAFNQEENRKQQQSIKDQQNLIKFSSEADKLQGVQASIKELENKIPYKIEDYDFSKKGFKVTDEKTGAVSYKKVDLPGASIPGIGRTKFYSSNARDLDSAFQTVFNNALKIRSGAAVTDQEFNRLLNEYAQGKFNSEPEMLNALKRMKQVQGRLFSNLEAGFEPRIIDMYRERGGQTSKDISGGKTFGNLPKMEVPKPQRLPQKGFSPSEEDEYQKWKQRQLGRTP